MKPAETGPPAARIAAAVNGPRLVTARSREEIEFLPAALEISEMPPSPTARYTALALAAVFVLALVWAAVGRIDIVAVAQGRIVPNGNSKVMQPLETASVHAIHVKDGQRVRAGEVVIELDPTAAAAEDRRLNGDLVAAELETARLRAAFIGKVEAFRPPAEAAEALVELQRQLLTSQIQAHAAKIGGIDWQIQQRQSERATYLATIDRLQASVELLQARFDIRDELHRKQLGSRITYLENKQALVESQKEIVVQRSHVATVDAALSGLNETRAETLAEYRRSVATEMAEAQRKAASLREEIVKAQQRTRLLSLAAPIDGTVQQLAVHTIGGVVTSAQPLLVIVPDGPRIEIEAMISNKDIGFVAEGQEAEIKIDAFDFTRYGLIRGRVVSVSRDAMVGNATGERDNGTRNGRDGRNAGSGSQDLMFAAKISLDASDISVEGRSIALAPGMTASVEIKTGSRSVLSYLLSPIAKYQHTALRER